MGWYANYTLLGKPFSPSLCCHHAGSSTHKPCTSKTSLDSFVQEDECLTKIHCKPRCCKAFHEANKVCKVIHELIRKISGRQEDWFPVNVNIVRCKMEVKIIEKTIGKVFELVMRWPAGKWMMEGQPSYKCCNIEQWFLGIFPCKSVIHNCFIHNAFLWCSSMRLPH